MQFWGVLNKEAPLRVCSTPGVPEATNVELKVRRTAAQAPCQPSVMVLSHDLDCLLMRR